MPFVKWIAPKNGKINPFSETKVAFAPGRDNLWSAQWRIGAGVPSRAGRADFTKVPPASTDR